jgi:hypothetical protein
VWVGGCECGRACMRVCVRYISGATYGIATTYPSRVTFQGS